jgi:6-phosphogluconolactonase
MKKAIISSFIMFLLFGCSSIKRSENKAKNDLGLVFVGTYTQDLGFVNGKATGIYICKADANGGLTVIDSATDIINPSFLTVSANKKYLYAVSETGTGKNGDADGIRFGKVVAYLIGQNGHLTKINETSSRGAAPCHISMAKSGNKVMVANYATGNIAQFNIMENGALSDSMPLLNTPKDMLWQHQITESPNSPFIYTIDKGSDMIYTYGFDNDTLMHFAATPTDKGAGPRHIAFSPNGDRAYVINELNSTICAYSTYKTVPIPRRIQTITTLPTDFKGKNSCAEIMVHPSGKFVYGSNRGHNSIAIYSVNEKTGLLTLVGHQSTGGAFPRSFNISGNLLLVANQNTDNVVAFRIDMETGLLSPTGANSRVMTPVCLAW